jgi:hypothetical protein
MNLTVGLIRNFYECSNKTPPLFGKGAAVQQFQKQPRMLFTGEDPSAGESMRCLPQRQLALFYMASTPLHRKIPERVSFELLYFNLVNIIPHSRKNYLVFSWLISALHTEVVQKQEVIIIRNNRL